MNALQSLLDLTSTKAPEECAPCALTASGSSQTRWQGILGMEGVMTGDGRFIEQDALYWEDLPLPIRYVASDMGAHDGAQVVGRITNIWRGDNGKIMGEGDFDEDSEHGMEAVRQVAENLTNGVSMDLDDVSFEVRMSSELVSLMDAEGVAPDEQAMADEEGRVKVATIKSDDEVRITTSGRIRAATIVAIPAFAEAKISLAAAAATFGYDPGQARVPKGQQGGGRWMDTPGGLVAMSSLLLAQSENSGRTADALNRDGGLGTGWESAGGPNAVREYTVPDDGSGYPRRLMFIVNTDNKSPDGWYFESYPADWSAGPSEADYDSPLYQTTQPTSLDKLIPQVEQVLRQEVKASAFASEETPASSLNSDDLLQGADNVPIEVYRGVQALKSTEQYEFASDEYMAASQAARDLFQKAVDKGFEAAQEVVDALDAFLSVNWTDLTDEDMKMPEDPEMEQAPDSSLMASAAKDFPPREWFRDPGLKEPTALTVTDDGRVYGHLAVWDTCHIGHAHSGCVKPPRSNANYAYFRVGATLTSDGTEVATGRITLETRHALGTLNATQTLAHYEDTGKVVADVAAGEDRHGIWIAGSLRPTATDDQIRALRGSPLSGDWRRIAGNLELVAALAVNVPGFPIPRPSGLVAGGAVQSLVASGMVPPRKVTPPGQPGALSAEDLRYLKRLAARERQVALSEAEQMRQKVQLSVLAMKRKTFALSNTGGA